MSRASQRFHTSVFVGPHLGVAVVFGSFLVLLAAVGVPALPLAFLGAVVGILGGLILPMIGHADAGEKPAVPPEVTADAELARLYRILCDTLIAVAARPDGILKAAHIQKLIALGVQFRAAASGAIDFSGAESWYVAHDAVLTVPDLKQYRAIVRVRTADCVQDPATQESLRAAFAAVYRGVLSERLLVLPELLWPRGQLLPAGNIRPWIEEPHNHGLRIILLRESQLGGEPTPLVDTCVFDDWAVGTRELDDRVRTIRVVLDFTTTTVRAALDRLDRLSQMGIPFGVLLDRAAGDE